MSTPRLMPVLGLAATVAVVACSGDASAPTAPLNPEPQPAVTPAPESAPPMALPALPVVDRTTDQIRVLEQRTVSLGGGEYALEFYRNEAYRCGLSGNYTFMVVHPVNQSKDDEAPLWIYLPGEGSGYFDDGENYVGTRDQTQDSWNHEQDFEDLRRSLSSRIVEGNEVEDNTLTRRLREGYRLVVVSGCDHDQYLGLGTPYPNNPNPGAEVNGLQATMAAVDYSLANYPTRHLFAHGTGAGATGAYALALSYSAEGKSLTGVIADSIPSRRGAAIQEALLGAPGSPFPADYEAKAFAEKAGFYATRESASDPESRIGAGFSATPLLFVGGVLDPLCGGDQAPLPAPSADNFENNCVWAASELVEAIGEQPDSLHEVVQLEGAEHVPTLHPGAAHDAVDAFIDRHVDDGPSGTPGLNALYIGHSFGRPFADRITSFTDRVGITNHRQQIVFSGGASGAPQALWDSPERSAEIKDILDTGEVDVLIMVCCSEAFVLDGLDPALALWISYALSKNPNTRFILALPWPDFPETYADAAAHAAPWLGGHDRWHAQIDVLRDSYPGVTIQCLPHGRAALDLRARFEAGTLPEIQALRGPRDSSLFTDEKGHAGELLKDVGTLVWLGALYEGADLSAALAEPYGTDVVSMAETILNEDSHLR